MDTVKSKYEIFLLKLQFSCSEKAIAHAGKNAKLIKSVEVKEESVCQKITTVMTKSWENARTIATA